MMMIEGGTLFQCDPATDASVGLGGPERFNRYLYHTIQLDHSCLDSAADLWTNNTVSLPLCKLQFE